MDEIIGFLQLVEQVRGVGVIWVLQRHDFSSATVLPTFTYIAT